MADVEEVTAQAPAAAHETPGPPVREALERRREALNGAFRLARFGAPHLVPAEVLAHVGGPIVRVLERVAAHDPAACVPVLHELFEASLELFARRLLGGATPSPAVARVFDEALPAGAALLAAAPGSLAAPLCNAAVALGRERPGLAGAWLDGMTAVAARCGDAGEWLAAGRVLAWRAGLAQHRAAALAALASLPAPVLGALGASAPALAAARADPWVSPFDGSRAEALTLAQRAGGHHALGGALADLPVVVRQAGRLFVLAGDDAFALHADRFGAALVRARPGAIPGGGEGEPVQVGAGGELRDGGQRRRLAWAAQPTSVAADATTVALTLAHSYLVYVLPRAPS